MDPIQIAPPTLGVRRDLDPEDIDANSLVNAENVVYRDGEFRVRPGLTTVANDVNERPMGYVDYEHSDGSRRVVKGTTGGWFHLSGGSWVDITGNALSGSFNNHVIFRTFPKAGETWLLGTNGANTLKKWDGVTNIYADVSGSPPRAATMGVIFDRVVLGNLQSGATVSPVAIDVSANKDFDSGYGTELVALLADTEGPIITIVEMGTLQGAVIKSDAIYMLIAQGGIIPFRIEWRRNIKVNGPPSQALATVLSSGEAFWVGKDCSVNIFDGSTVSQMPYYVQKAILSSCNTERLNRGWLEYNSNRREMLIVYPLIGNDEPNGGVLLNLATRAVYPWRFPLSFSAGKMTAVSGLTFADLLGRSFGSLSQTFGELSQSLKRRMLMGETGGQSFENIGLTDNGTSIPFFWETGLRGQMERFMTLKRIRHRFQPTVNPQNVSLKVGKSNEGGVITHGAAKTIATNGAGRKATGHRTSAEYFSLRFEGNATEDVVYQGSAAYVRKRGRR